MKIVLLMALVFLVGCDNGDIEDAIPIEVLTMQPINLTVEAEGQLKAVNSTPLTVPGERGAQRQLIWMLPEGSPVMAGEVIARFSAEGAKLDLAKALLDLQRNTLARAAKEGELFITQGRTDVDLAQVSIDLGIAQRYVSAADLGTFARNQILDAVQDEHFLGVRQKTLRWQRAQATRRGEAEFAILDSQRATFRLIAVTRGEDLKSLELRAPHAGVLIVDSDWAGEKPRVGVSLRAGQSFGRLPNTASYEVELSLPRQEAQALRNGLAVDLYPRGRPAQAVRSSLFWISSIPQVRSRQSPVKYMLMKAALNRVIARERRWVPGQIFSARIHITKSQRGLTVPSLAVLNENGRSFVIVRNGGKIEHREVRLGPSGDDRSLVISGLSEGEVILLAPPVSNHRKVRS